MSIEFNERVAIVTGAGNGLGKSHALELARRGAKVVVNDFGGARDGTGGSLGPADLVVEEILAAGGEAIANGANVTDYGEVEAMVDAAISKWRRVDILVNNAGILRDKSFSKMEMSDWHAVIDVHLNGTANCCRAAWPHMKDAGYGRIVMTSSTSGIYGNFGQANYGAAKFGVVGLMNTLHIEGAKYDIRVNCVSPTAATRMTKDIMPEEMLALLDPTLVTPAVVFMVCDQAPSRKVMFAGAGCYAVLNISESEGVWLPEHQRDADGVAANFAAIEDITNTHHFTDGGQHVARIVQKAATAKI